MKTDNKRSKDSRKPIKSSQITPISVPLFQRGIKIRNPDDCRKFGNRMLSLKLRGFLSNEDLKACSSMLGEVRRAISLRDEERLIRELERMEEKLNETSSNSRRQVL